MLIFNIIKLWRALSSISFHYSLFLFLLFIPQQWVTFSLKRFPYTIYISFNSGIFHSTKINPQEILYFFFYFNPVKIIHISLLSGKKYFCTYPNSTKKKMEGYEKNITFQRQRQIRALTSGFLLLFVFFFLSLFNT